MPGSNVVYGLIDWVHLIKMERGRNCGPCFIWKVFK